MFKLCKVVQNVQNCAKCSVLTVHTGFTGLTGLTGLNGFHKLKMGLLNDSLTGLTCRDASTSKNIEHSFVFTLPFAHCTFNSLNVTVHFISCCVIGQSILECHKWAKLSSRPVTLSIKC